ncbi:MAG: N-acetyl-gamma-glutamyl-phosphate reductase [Myxococcales bacterium]|nr:MAG: N-acetyl-gamma-glutamyl-phosphate reductase [Myxococcales bacterium]
MDKGTQLRLAVLGISGYTGAELLRLIASHPSLRLCHALGRSQVGTPLGRIHPQLACYRDVVVESLDAYDLSDKVDAALLALPHQTSMEHVSRLNKQGVCAIDLSADFRLTEQSVYEKWYAKHLAPQLLKKAVYGMVDLFPEGIDQADIISVPGCYPTASVLAAAPLIKNKLIALDTIIVDAKSGVSGAGKTPSAASHFAECSEGVRAYKMGGLHRHTPEIEQSLSKLAEEQVTITFSPHLIPMTRGILATVYAKSSDATLTAEQCTEAAKILYKDSALVHVLDGGQNPDTLHVRGSNQCHLSYTVDKRTGRVIAQAAIDNLVKGAAGQAIQCLNLRFGLSRDTGVDSSAIFP